MFWDLLQVVSKLSGMFFQHAIVTLAVTPKPMVISNDNGMRVKTGHQEIPDVLFRWLICKNGGKGNYHQVINAKPGQQLDLLVKRVN
jgi:hypothetical protein